MIDSGATHLLLLNSDTSFGNQFIEGWLAVIGQRPEAIISPLIYWFDRPTEVWFSGGDMSISYFRLARKFTEMTEVDIVCGCTVLVPAKAWRRLGGFDQRIITYYEDFDLALRAKKLGVPILTAPDPALRVLHKVSGSFRKTGPVEEAAPDAASAVGLWRLHFRGIRKLLSFGLAARIWACRSCCICRLCRKLWAAAVAGMKIEV